MYFLCMDLHFSLSFGRYSGAVVKGPWPNFRFGFSHTLSSFWKKNWPWSFFFFLFFLLLESEAQKSRAGTTSLKALAESWHAAISAYSRDTVKCNISGVGKGPAHSELWQRRGSYIVKKLYNRTNL